MMRITRKVVNGLLADVTIQTGGMVRLSHVSHGGSEPLYVISYMRRNGQIDRQVGIGGGTRGAYEYVRGMRDGIAELDRWNHDQ